MLMYEGKYIRFYEFMKNMDAEVGKITLTFKQIEIILQFSLPDSAYKHDAWWANEKEGTHSHARSWRQAGWKKDCVKVGHKVTFVRE